MDGTALLPEEIDLTALANEILARLQGSVPGRSAELFVMQGLRARGDRRAVEAALEEILGNAWEHTARRSAALILFGSSPNGANPVYFVRDNGAGFDGARAEQFYLCLNGFATSPGGQEEGLPLAKAKKLIEAMGGRIWAKPAAAQGVVVYFTLGRDARPIA